MEESIEETYEIEYIKEEEELCNEDEDSFEVVFTEGFIFKSLIEFFKQTTQKGNFNFSSQKIRYEKMDLSKKILNILEINCEIIPYSFHSNSEEVIFGINFKDIVAIIGKVKRKEGVKLRKLPRDNKLYISVIPSGDSSLDDNNYGTIIPYSEQDLSYSINDEEKNSEKNDKNKEHSFVIPTIKFVNACNRITSIKCIDITMRSEGKGAIFETMIGGTVNKKEILGDLRTTHSSPTMTRQTDDEKKEETDNCIKIDINPNTVKALAKLGNLCQNGSIKISMERNRPLKIITPVSNYGILKTYIFSDEILKSERKRSK